MVPGAACLGSCCLPGWVLWCFPAQLELISTCHSFLKVPCAMGMGKEVKPPQILWHSGNHRIGHQLPALPDLHFLTNLGLLWKSGLVLKFAKSSLCLRPHWQENSLRIQPILVFLAVSHIFVSQENWRWHSGLWGGDKVRIRHRLDWMILEIFPNLNNSGIPKDFLCCLEILEQEAFLDGNSLPACWIQLPVGCLNSCGHLGAVLKVA